MESAKERLLESYRREHSQLDAGLTALTELLDRLRGDADPALTGALAQTDSFFQRILLPHAEWEELTFYPALADLLKHHGDPNACMLADHREIVARVEVFSGLVRRIEGGERDPELIDAARILGYQVKALVEVHWRKEEEIYCALLHRHLSDREALNALALGDQMGHD